jgi:hypothetical protein
MYGKDAFVTVNGALSLAGSLHGQAWVARKKRRMANESLMNSQRVALMVIEADSARAAPPRPLASFVTQMIAARAGVPEARARRRLAPGEASSRYRDGPATAPSARCLDKAL